MSSGSKRALIQIGLSTIAEKMTLGICFKNGQGVRTAKMKIALVIALIGLAALAGATRAGDVIVVGATPAGISAAVSAARSGASVLLLEEKAHIGGIVSGGLTMNDIRYKRAVKGLFEEFRRRVLEHYTTTYGADSQQAKDSRDGNHYEPHVAERIFTEMLGAEKRVRILLRHRLRAAHREGAKLTRVVMEDLARGGAAVEFSGSVFIDATYEGDLAAMAGAPYRVGRESRGEYGER